MVSLIIDYSFYGRGGGVNLDIESEALRRFVGGNRDDHTGAIG